MDISGGGSLVLKMEEKQKSGFLLTFVIVAASPNKKQVSSVANEDMKKLRILFSPFVFVLFVLPIAILFEIITWICVEWRDWDEIVRNDF